MGARLGKIVCHHVFLARLARAFLRLCQSVARPVLSEERDGTFRKHSMDQQEQRGFRTTLAQHYENVSEYPGIDFLRRPLGASDVQRESQHSLFIRRNELLESRFVAALHCCPQFPQALLREAQLEPEPAATGSMLHQQLSPPCIERDSGTRDV